MDLLLRDVRNQDGALPLLQHALLELWHKRQGRRLTVQAYHEIRKLEGALQRRADATLEGLLEPERELCRQATKCKSTTPEISVKSVHELSARVYDLRDRVYYITALREERHEAKSRSVSRETRAKPRPTIASAILRLGFAA